MNPVMQEAGRKAYLTKMANKAAREALANAAGQLTDEAAKALLTKVADAASGIPTVPGFEMRDGLTATEHATASNAQAMSDAAALAACPKMKAPKKAKVPEAPATDPRLPTNLEPHVELPRALAGYSVGQATKARKATMKACKCRLCALALKPPLTFAESALFGLDTIGAEHKAFVKGLGP